MGRRTVLLVVAALLAVLGSSLVFLYVKGADARASQRYQLVSVLTAVETINPGETFAAAQQAGKIESRSVPRGQALAGSTNTGDGLGNEVALTTLYRGEQIIAAKFGAPGAQDVLNIPDGKMAISVNLSDPARVAGFVAPGADVAIFASGEKGTGATGTAAQFTRLLLPRVQVIGVGTTTVVSTTTTDQSGASTTEQLPRTLLTLAVDQSEAERVLFAARSGEIAFALLTDKSTVKPSTGVTTRNVFP